MNDRSLDAFIHRAFFSRIRMNFMISFSITLNEVEREETIKEERAA